MPKIAIGTDILNDISKGLRKEWITTNGLGGYASSTVLGCNTRRYHGLLVAPREKDERAVLLSKLEESIKIGHRYYSLGTNKYTENYIHPRGYTHLRKFEQAPFPRFIFTIDEITVTKEIFMPHGQNTTIIRYNIFGGNRDFIFIVRPLVAFVNFHQIAGENRDFDTSTTYQGSTLLMKPYENFPTLKLHLPGMKFKNLKNWYKNFTLDRERERGLDYIGDLFNPGYYYTPKVKDFKIDIIATSEDKIPEDTEKLYDEAKRRVDYLFDLAEANSDDPDEKSLVLAADLHIINSPTSGGEKRATIVAGYHWFGDWGRDTFISLPGIALCTGRYEEAREILHSFTLQCKDGLIPNRFADLGQSASYNTVDASLWYINAVQAYIDYSGDSDFIKEHIFETCKSIMKSYEDGTLYGIGMDEDGLINAGEEGYQLTWMDARVGEWVVTPRMGKPVEINALWYNALCIMAKLAGKFGNEELEKHYSELAGKVKISFNEKFWYERGGYLYDVVGETINDDSFRPNQIFAISLPHQVLDENRAKNVANIVYEKLYTPFGIRSLSLDNLNYKGIYTGDVRNRDASYHQGIAWGFLLGPFLEAYLKVNKFSPSAVMRADILMALWMGDLTNAGQNTLSEIINGDEPFTPRGCISQAWSIGEALRLKKIINKLKFEPINKTMDRGNPDC